MIKKRVNNSRRMTVSTKSVKNTGLRFDLKKISAVPADDWYSAVIRSVTEKADTFLVGVAPYTVNKKGTKQFFAKAYLRIDKEYESGSLTEKFIEFFGIDGNTAVEDIKESEIEVYIEMNEGNEKTFYNVTDIAAPDDDSEEDEDGYEDSYEDSDEEEDEDSLFEKDD